MFCSNCGKSVANDPSITSCPHCGMALGDVRFPGMPYTSIQFRIVPGTPMPIDEAYSYTRTNYSVNIAEGEMGDPIEQNADGDAAESATIYRPVLRNEDEEEIVEEEPAEEENAESNEDIDNIEVDPDSLSENEIAEALKRMQADGLDTDVLNFDAKYEQDEVSAEELDERIEMYENDQRADMERRQQKSRGKFKFPFGKKPAYDGVDDADENYGEAFDAQDYEDEVYQEAPAAEAEDTEAPVDAEPFDGEAYDGEPAAEADPDAVYEEAYGEPEAFDEYAEEGFDEGAPRASFMDMTVAGIRMANILKVAAGLVVLVVCIVLGLKWFGYVSDQQQKSPISGVSLSLYQKGIEMIEENAATEKTTAMLSTYKTSGVVAFTALQQQYTDSLNALKPAEPGVNDELFLDALTTIQTNIANAVIMDAMTGDASSEASKQNWASITDSITALKSATDSVHLQAITNQTVEVVTTTPTPAATPVSYKTLTKGDEGDDVMKLQQRLFDLGYLVDAADGKFGNKTTTAVKYFQMGMDLPVTGIADSATQTMLYSDEALNMEDGKAAYQARQAEGNE